MQLAKFTYSSLKKGLEQQTKKKVDALKSLILSNETYELKQIDSMFPQNMINDLVRHRPKNISKLQDTINLNKLHYKAKRENCIISVKRHCVLHF